MHAMIKSDALLRSLCGLAVFFSGIAYCQATSSETITLQQAYEMSLNNSTKLKVARFQQMAETRRLRLDSWTFIPTLAFNVSDSRKTKYNAADSDSINVASTLSIPVTQGGRKKMKLENQEIALQAQGVQLTQSENEIKDSCFTLFNQITIQRLKLKTLREQKEIIEKQYAIAQKEFEMGQIREIDLIETKLNIASLSESIFTAETELLSEEYNLKKLLGIDQEKEINLVSEIDNTYNGITLNQSKQRLKNEAMCRNTDIQESRFKVEQSRLNNMIANSAWIPNVGLQTSVQVSGESYPLQHPNYGLRATVEFPFDLIPVNFSLGFSSTPGIEYGRTSSANISTADSLDSIVDKQLTRITYMQTVEENITAEQDVEFQLDQSLLNYERLKMEQRLTRQKMEIQAQKVNIMEVQLDIGQVTRVDFLKGENDLLSTRLDILSGVLTLIQAERGIEKLAGLDFGDLKRMGKNEE